MALNAIYQTLEEIPEQFRELYTERMSADGQKQFELTGITGTKTEADIARVQEGLRKEKEDHKNTKGELSGLKTTLGAWAGLKPEELQAKIDGYDALELAANSAGSVSAEEIQKRLTAELARHTAPLERKITDLGTTLETLTQENVAFKEAARVRAIHDAVRSAALTPASNAAKILDTALEDALMHAERVFEVDENGKVTTKDQVGCTPGLTPDLWLVEMQPKRPHWWPESIGGGAKGAKNNGYTGGENPWSAKSFNLTKQGEYIKTNGIEKAKQMASLAGTTVGGARPHQKSD